jgi:AraC-like DNA-binding protein
VIRVPNGSALTGAFGRRTEMVLSYHVMVEGWCWTGVEGGAPVRLERGDVVVYPRGDPYYLSCDVSPGRGGDDSARLAELLRAVSRGEVPPRFGFADGPAPTTFVCGFLGCDSSSFHPLLSRLPPMLHLRGAEGRLARLVDLALAEVDGTMGDALVRERLSESMFLETIRQYLSAADESSWPASLRDPVVGRALALLHGDPAQPWTLPTLAKAVSASRSVLVDHFTKAIGESPMHYLAHRRLGLAERLLVDGDITVAAVARQVGYQSDAAFSRAFKRTVGVAPAVWRATSSR